MGRECEAIINREAPISQLRHSLKKPQFNFTFFLAAFALANEMDYYCLALSV